MNKLRWILLGLLVSLLLLACTGLPVLAAQSRVTYKGIADRFVFVPDSRDLFQNFKGVMPGDTLNQEIQLANQTDNIARIFLEGKALLPREADFLSKARLTGRIGGSLIFDYQAPETSLTEMVLLKELAPHEAVTLTVELSVPSELTNAYQSQEYAIQWIFLAEEEAVAGEEEEVPEETEEAKPPVTGESNPYQWAALLLFVAGLVFIALAIKPGQKKS